MKEKRRRKKEKKRKKKKDKNNKKKKKKKNSLFSNHTHIFISFHVLFFSFLSLSLSSPLPFSCNSFLPRQSHGTLFCP